ncbi:MAG: AAA family ATPase [Myxococcota bacterium]
MARLSTGRSLLAIDEPERHLHPALLGRVIALLEGLDDGAPVLLSTHSTACSNSSMTLLPPFGVQPGTGKAVIARIDPAVLPQWLEFGDFGRLRAAGYLSSVVKSPSAAPVADSGRTK